jgi:hypothetical protein
MRRAVAVAAASVLLAGCGGGSTSLSTGAGNTLRADVLALTQDAAAHQWSMADQALAQLRSDLTAAIAANEVSAAQAQAIRTDVASIAGDLAARRMAGIPTTSSSSSSAPKPRPQPKPAETKRPPKHGHGHDHGHGHGHGGEDGGD